MAILPQHIRNKIGTLLVNKDLETARVKVESGNAAFDEGKIFRAFYPVELDGGAISRRVFKFVITGDITLLKSEIDIDAGGIDYRVYTSGTESGTFTPITSYRTNGMSGTPTPTSNVTVYTDGTLTVTEGTHNDLIRVRSAGANSKQSTVGISADDMRGFPATTAYVVIKSLDGQNTAAKGVIKWQWQNR